MKASMRFLVVLLDPGTADMERLEILEEAKHHNINRFQFYQAVKELKRMGFIEDVQPSRTGKRKVFTTLTEEGSKIASLVVKIRDTL
jgi:DNA-binding MarR family transcriptional regulator